MPELPDVENFKKYFKKTSLHKKVENIESNQKSLIRKITFNDFKKKIIGHKFEDAWRRGKFLIIEIGGISEKLIFHFGMTGYLSYFKQGKESHFAKVVFNFNNGYKLEWINKRKLGKIYLVEDIREISLLKNMGVEPLEISEKEFLELLENNKSRGIKSFFMDQTEIAGIGNIFSDEIFFRAKISPKSKIQDLSNSKKKALYDKMKKVLKEAIKIGPPEGSFDPSRWLIPHRQKDMKCPNGHDLKKETIAGRSSYYCPICQK
ncbi:MAG: Fpg/Nei family DNA glycosylase [Candidatus Portnoybacteria bacterium]|nr:Fpg/Nei family DNA glycosylase [Candidatus Portnoybacteria bacterium]